LSSLRPPNDYDTKEWRSIGPLSISIKARRRLGNLCLCAAMMAASPAGMLVGKIMVGPRDGLPAPAMALRSKVVELERHVAPPPKPTSYQPGHALA